MTGTPYGPHHRRRLPEGGRQPFRIGPDGNAPRTPARERDRSHRRPENDKPTVLALREIADHTIDMPTIDEIDRVERERRDREALEWAAAEVDEDMAKGVDEL
jgi:hypothetical protein